MDVSWQEGLEEYGKLITNYPIFFFFFLASLILGYLLWYNKTDRKKYFITFCTALVIIGETFYLRGSNVIEQLHTIFRWNFYQNIYVYYWNMIISFVLLHIYLSMTKRKSSEQDIGIVFYVCLFVNALFQVYISSIVGHQGLLVLGNTYPMVMIGNGLSFLFYFYLLGMEIRNLCQKKLI